MDCWRLFWIILGNKAINHSMLHCHHRKRRRNVQNLSFVPLWTDNLRNFQCVFHVRHINAIHIFHLVPRSKENLISGGDITIFGWYKITKIYWLAFSCLCLFFWCDCFARRHCCNPINIGLCSLLFCRYV